MFLVGLLSEMCLEPVRVNDETGASANGIMMTMTTSLSHGICVILDLGAQAIVILSCYTLIFSVIGTVPKSVFLPFSLDVCSFRTCAYFPTSLSRPTTVCSGLVVLLSCQRFSFQRKVSLRDTTRRRLSSHVN